MDDRYDDANFDTANVDIIYQTAGLEIIRMSRAVTEDKVVAGVYIKDRYILITGDGVRVEIGHTHAYLDLGPRSVWDKVNAAYHALCVNFPSFPRIVLHIYEFAHYFTHVGIPTAVVHGLVYAARGYEISESIVKAITKSRKTYEVTLHKYDLKVDEQDIHDVRLTIAEHRAIRDSWKGKAVQEWWEARRAA